MTISEIIEQLHREIDFITGNPDMAAELRTEHGDIAHRLLHDLQELIGSA